MEWVIGVIAAIFVIVLGANSIKVVQQGRKGLVERLGKYTRTLDPGLQLVFPFINVVRMVDMREQVIDVPPQEVITKDNVVVTVDAIVYYQVTDPVRVQYNVANFQLATIKLAQTNLRNVIGDLELDETLTSRERVNNQLRQILDDATDPWGVRITRVEIQKIDPPRDITDAMGQQMKAERERRARVLEAEGIKQAAITKAEGERESAILSADGRAQAIERMAEAERIKQIKVAEGEAQAIATVYRAIHEGRPTSDLLAVKYLEALQKIADGKATKVFLPMETSSVLGSVAALGEMFREGISTRALELEEEETPKGRLAGEAAAAEGVKAR